MRKLLFSLFALIVVTAMTVSASASAPLAKKQAGKKAAKIEQAMKTRIDKKQKGVDTRLLPKTRKAVSGKSQLKAMPKSQVISPKKAAKVRAAASGAALPTNLIGSLSFSEDQSAELGIYKFPATSGGELELLFPAETCYSGVVVDGKYYASNLYDFLGMFQFPEVYSYDMETGEATYFEVSTYDCVFFSQTLNPVDGKVYAFGFTAEGDGQQLSTVEYGEGTVTVTPFALTEENWNSIACDPQGQLYGISADGDLYKINSVNGQTEKVGATGVTPYYMSDATIDPKNGRMYWSVSPMDGSGLLYEVNKETGEATLLYQLPNNEEMVGLACITPDAEDDAPGAVSDFACDFAEGALEGTVSFTAPTTTFAGAPLEGTLTYHVVIDGEEDSNGEVAPGAAVSVPVRFRASGRYAFQAYVSNAVGDGPKAKASMFIGPDMPLPVENVHAAYADGTMTISWDAVTESENGGYIDPAGITYIVKRVSPDEAVIAQHITATSASEAVAMPETQVKYQYEVILDYQGLQYNGVLTNVVSLGTIVPPYQESFDDQDAFAGFTVEDANGDKNTWSFYDNTARYIYSSYDAGDDWLFTPAMKLQGGKLYNLSFDAYAKGYTEKLEVYYGKAASAAGMTELLVEPTEITSAAENPTVLTGELTPAEDGLYYIGFHAISDPDQFYLFVDNIAVSAPSSLGAPDAVGSLKVEGDATGALRATVSFVVPGKTMGGDELKSIEKIEISRDGEVVKTFNDPTIGAVLTYVDEVEADGIYTYKVVAFNAEGPGREASASDYVGVDVPAKPADVTIAETPIPGEVRIGWSGVTTDINGRPINPESVKYHVYTYGDYGWEATEHVDLIGTAVTFQAVDPAEQDFVYYGVVAESDKGMNTSLAVTPMIAVGNPFDGWTESFTGQSLSYMLGTNSEGGMEAGIGTEEDTGIPAQDDDAFVYLNGSYLGDYGEIFTGKIRLDKFVNPELTFYLMPMANDDTNTVTVTIEPTGEEEVELAKYTLNELDDQTGWNKVRVNLLPYRNKIFQLHFKGDVNAYGAIVFDNFRIKDAVDHDLVISSISAPAKVNAGSDYTVNVKLYNDGVVKASGYNVQLFVEGEEAGICYTGEDIETDKSAVIPFTVSMHELAENAVEMYAVVNYELDLVKENNTSDFITVAPKVSSYPAVNDLAGEAAEGVNKLTWSAPDLSAPVAETVNESFEDGESFAQEYEGWTFVDGDGLKVGGFENLDIPGMVAGQDPGKFFVFDASGSQFNESFAAHSGNYYIAALFNAMSAGANEDWAISPSLSGEAQTISFWAKSYHHSYLESMKLYYSTGSVEPADFIEVEEVNAIPNEWTEYTIDVPAGARRFAVCYTSDDCFMLMLDDFSYETAGETAGLEIQGYNIFRNGEKINKAPVAETSYADTNAPAGANSYRVTVVYNAGTSKGSNEVRIDLSGVDDIEAAAITIEAADKAIVISGAEGAEITVAAVDGKVIYNAEGAACTRVPAATGVYVVKAGAKVAKVIVK